MILTIEENLDTYIVKPLQDFFKMIGAGFSYIYNLVIDYPLYAVLALILIILIVLISVKGNKKNDKNK